MTSITRQSSRDRYCLAAALVGFGCWLAAIGPVRMWFAHAGPVARWFIGVTPSFLAAWTFAFWQAFAVRARPVAAVTYAAALLATTEIVQLFLPRYTADMWDVAAGILGAVAALPVLLRRERLRPKAQSPKPKA